MPTVGKKKFAYTAKGKRAAKRVAKKKNKKVSQHLHAIFGIVQFHIVRKFVEPIPPKIPKEPWSILHRPNDVRLVSVLLRFDRVGYIGIVGGPLGIIRRPMAWFKHVSKYS